MSIHTEADLIKQQLVNFNAEYKRELKQITDQETELKEKRNKLREKYQTKLNPLITDDLIIEWSSMIQSNSKINDFGWRDNHTKCNLILAACNSLPTHYQLLMLERFGIKQSMNY